MGPFLLVFPVKPRAAGRLPLLYREYLGLTLFSKSDLVQAALRRNPPELKGYGRRPLQSFLKKSSFFSSMSHDLSEQGATTSSLPTLLHVSNLEEP